MQLAEYKRVIAKIAADRPSPTQIQDLHDMLIGLRSEHGLKDPALKHFAIQYSNYGRDLAAYMAGQTGKAEYDALYWRMRLFEAQLGIVDSYFLYLEKNRDDEKKFYEPRREKFLKFGIIQGMQDLVDDKIDLLTLSLPPGTGKSTAGIFFLSGCMGWWPDEPNLASAHSGILTRSFYDGVSQILSDPYEYTWHEIFPEVKFNARTGFNSKEQTINVGRPTRFKSLTCRAINASLTGATRCERILYADDLCSGIEEALSKERLDKLWQTYNTDLKTRKKNEAKEIHIATRWSVGDVIGRLQREHENDPRARFVSVPAFDENGESNFDYDYGVGFTKEYFEDMKLSMDDISFRCLYMNEPIEREGLLYNEDEVRRYLTLPIEPPEAVLSLADTKNKGTDYFTQPVFAKYGDDYYMIDTICDDNADYEVQYSRSVDTIITNHVEAMRVESNNGGSRVAFELNRRLQEAGHYCNITENYTTTNKETKIIVYAPWVKQHVLFKDKSMYQPKSDYGRFMSLLFSYTIAGKNTHDDPPDALAMFAEWAGGGMEKPTRIIGSIF